MIRQPLREFKCKPWGRDLAGPDRARGGESNSKTRGKGTAKGRRFAPSFYPALPRWAKLCRAYGAGGLVGCRSRGGVYGNEAIVAIALKVSFHISLLPQGSTRPASQIYSRSYTNHVA